MHDKRADGWEPVYDLSVSGERDYSGSALQVVEFLLAKLSSQELQDLKLKTIPRVQVEHNTARGDEESKAVKRAARLRREFLARAPEDVDLPRVYTGGDGAIDLDTAPAADQPTERVEVNADAAQYAE